MPVAEINVHIEPKSKEPGVGAQLEPQEANSYAERVQAIGFDLPESGGCHDIEVHRIDGRIYLSLHLLVNEGAAISEVHSIAEEMENRLRREFPELGRVVIHTEPANK